MARNIGTVLVNNLSRGLITEATGLNFPDNAVTEAWNTVFERVGSVTRRRGFDLEAQAETLAYDTTNGILKEFIWQSVALTGGFTFLVLQVGWNIHFFELSLNSALSAGVQPESIDLRDYRAPGANVNRHTPASFTAGAGYLFIAHPSCEPLIVRYNDVENVFEVAMITVQIRDHEGVEDGLAVNENPSTASTQHLYNLKNQGWYKPVRVGSANNETGGSWVVNEPKWPLEWDDL